MWPVRFTDIIFASIILIVCAHGEGGRVDNFKQKLVL